MAETNSEEMAGAPLNSDTTDFIIAGYNQLHSYLRNDEGFEHKVSFAIGGFFLAFGALMLRRQFGSITYNVSLIMSGFLIMVAIVTNAFLVSNIKEMRTICQRIVSFEKAMGFYSEGLLPAELQKWGLKDSKHNFNSWPYVAGIWASVAIAVVSLWYIYLVDPKTPDIESPTATMSVSLLSPAPIDIRLREYDRLDSQLLATINDTLQQLSKTVDRLVPAVNLLVQQQAQPQPSPHRPRHNPAH